jgi:glycosyltransferase involved in cell wall biosynthesis
MGFSGSTSLLIPCYNAARFLPQLKLVVDSLCPAFDEVLLVDDASTDSTVELARKLGFTIALLDRNRGPGGARNFIAEQCQGEWIHFLDADDLLDSSYLAEVLAVADDSIDVVLSSAEFVFEDTRLLEKRWSYDQKSLDADAVQACFCSPIPLHCTLLRKSLFLKIGGFKEDYRCWEDGDMHLRLAAAGARFRVIPEVLSTSLRHRSGASGNHAYCHKCRLAFIESYIKNKLPISCDSLRAELCSIGYLLMYSCQYKLAYRAHTLFENLGGPRATTNNSIFRVLLRCLPIRMGHFMSALIKSHRKKCI